MMVRVLISMLNILSTNKIYLPSLSSTVMLALDGFIMAAGSVDVRVTIIVSEPSTVLSSTMDIVTVRHDVAASNVRSLFVTV